VGEEPNPLKAGRVELFKLRLELAYYTFISQSIYIIILYCVACEYLDWIYDLYRVLIICCMSVLFNTGHMLILLNVVLYISSGIFVFYIGMSIASNLGGGAETGEGGG
jgi:hypothetical protein